MYTFIKETYESIKYMIAHSSVYLSTEVGSCINGSRASTCFCQGASLLVLQL